MTFDRCFMMGVIILVLTIAGCGPSKLQKSLDSGIGKMNYEESIQQFGPPAKCAEAGKTKSCIWHYGTGPGAALPVGSMILTDPGEPRYMILTFTNDVLSNWKCQGKFK